MRAAELPPPLVHAFVDAIDAWRIVEEDLYAVWRLLRRETDADAAWATFSKLSTSDQPRQTLRLVVEKMGDTPAADSLRKVIERVPALADVRNRIVHGRWHKIDVFEGNRRVDPEFIRIYDARGSHARPRNEAEEKPMLGRSRFYEGDLREAEKAFRALARDLHLSIESIIPFIAPRAFGGEAE